MKNAATARKLTYTVEFQTDAPVWDIWCEDVSKARADAAVLFLFSDDTEVTEIRITINGRK